ncbi:hypothetical protein NDU88_004406 [Pleurodeles waltl]|uniref:Uncharacterized protein n=1 Tax=Pleurodeles waltl TaxID=8319 RepID=A0AAV7NSE4_PLEWA|nr:hypothetical protein NDU88_004406 [Pleurodeles waltl]
MGVRSGARPVRRAQGADLAARAPPCLWSRWELDGGTRGVLQYLQMRRTEQAWGQGTWTDMAEKRTRPCGPGPFPARGRTANRTAARERARNTCGCGERNRPGDGAHGLTWQRSAKLRITHNQNTHLFDSPDLVSTWLEENFPYSWAVEQNNGHHAGQLPQHRRDKRNKAQTSQKRTGPTLRQALEGQNNALQTAGSLREMNSTPCRTASSIDSIAASDSEGSMALFPDITPQLAIDF